MSSDRRTPNHLAGETSPYLLQHLYNPVDWHPWGREALERARMEDRPIFLSIGYAACHWCHVMERESFEDREIAEILNRHFVPIKLDREERPDIDEIYMNAVQVMTGQGGWPLNVFLTPTLEPFFGGTYFPPEDRHGRVGFGSLLRTVHSHWSGQRDRIEQAAGDLTERLRLIAAGAVGSPGASRIGTPEVSRAAADLAGRFDPTWGGFGGAPKFPPDGALALLLHLHASTGEAIPLQMAATTLDRMALGGMYDHVGGGFARYSVDERWLVPHFEKMLYNQALLVPVYLDAWLLERKPLYRRTVEETLDFVRRELTDGGGGFHSSLDADSEGHEGKFYVWKPAQIDEVLGREDGALFREIYDITVPGNFEGRSIPNLLGGSLEQRAADMGIDEVELAKRLLPLREKLLAAREQRVRPGKDDKVLTSWNGLMIGAFARAYQTLGRPQDLDTARRAADFLLDRLVRDGRLLVSYRENEAKLNAYLDDYAFVCRGLLDLYEACFDERYLRRAVELAECIPARFGDAERGGFFFTSDDHETLLTRNRSQHDGALPSGAGVATEVLLRLAVHTDRDDLRRAATLTLEAYRPAVERMPSAFTSLLLASALSGGDLREIAVVGHAEAPETLALLAEVRRDYLLRPAIQVGPPRPAGDRMALLAGKSLVDGRPTAYVCRNHVCEAPTSIPRALHAELRRKKAPG